MTLKEELRQELMLTTAISDDAMESMIQAAQLKLRLPGVDESHIEADMMVRDAVKAYVKAHYALAYESDVNKHMAWLRIFDQYRAELSLTREYREVKKDAEGSGG